MKSRAVLLLVFLAYSAVAETNPSVKGYINIRAKFNGTDFPAFQVPVLKIPSQIPEDVLKALIKNTFFLFPAGSLPATTVATSLLPKAIDVSYLAKYMDLLPVSLLNIIPKPVLAELKKAIIIQVPSVPVPVLPINFPNSYTIVTFTAA